MIRAVGLLGVALLAPVASAGMVYSFMNITNNDIGDAMAGEAQLFVSVQSAGPGQASFIFENDGPDAMSIAEIYFDDGTLLGIASVINGPGVDFEQGASPPDLPGGESISPPFNVTAGFLAEGTPPPVFNGVNPGEWVEIIFNLQPGMDIFDVWDALDGGVDLRIGIHVIGFEGGGSESFVNKPPAPGALGLLGFAGLYASRRRR